LAPATAEIAQVEPTASDLRAAQALDAVRYDPLALRVFLKRMPKGAELHNHLHSAVFAETLIRDARRRQALRG
jgi:adenosine deaminase